MAEASRFPHLALPFAIVGAAGGWLSANLVANPLVQRFRWDVRVHATLVAALLAGKADPYLSGPDGTPLEVALAAAAWDAAELLSPFGA